jgi:magnesium transporter
MGRVYKRIAKKVGLPPGTLVYVGDKEVAKSKITLIDYNATEFYEKVLGSVDECFPFKERNTVTWLNIDGLHDVETMRKIETRFGIHPLVMEDVLHTEQRPKLEDHGDSVFIVLKMLTQDPRKDEINAEQISLIIGPNYLLSFQETVGDIFDIIRDRLRNNKGRVRRMGADYLAYSLMDAIVDHYFVILERVGEKIEWLEEQLILDTTADMSMQIHLHKRDMVFLRRQIWPLRDVISGLQRLESDLIADTTFPYFRDLYDHTIQVMDTIESFKDLLTGMLEIFLSSINIKMNEVMKFLTLIATIFIPPTFVVGLYGMNFKFMPELDAWWGYPMVWIVIICMILGLLFYFRKKRWF